MLKLFSRGHFAFLKHQFVHFPLIHVTTPPCITHLCWHYVGSCALIKISHGSYTKRPIICIDLNLSVNPYMYRPSTPQIAPTASLPLRWLSVLNCLRHDTVLRSDVTSCSRDEWHLMLCYYGTNVIPRL